MNKQRAKHFAPIRELIRKAPTQHYQQQTTQTRDRKGQSTCHDSDSLYQFCAVIVVIVVVVFLMQLHEQVPIAK
jgi:hypothetical protein